MAAVEVVGVVVNRLWIGMNRSRGLKVDDLVEEEEEVKLGIVLED